MAIRAISKEAEHDYVTTEVHAYADMLTERIKEQVRIYERDNPDYEFNKVEYDYNNGNFKLNVLFKHRSINVEVTN